MILPNLDERIRWYQSVMRPDDQAMGEGIADWTITAEYQNAPQVNGKDVWGCLCSPGAMPAFRPLTADDERAKRAHLVLRAPRTMADLDQLERTLLHELGHVLLVGARTTSVQGEENAMHSMDALFAKLTPAQRTLLTRAMADSSARLVAQGETMDGDDKTKSPEAPAAGEVMKQEAAPRDVAAITAELALADKTNLDLLAKLAEELKAALVAKAVAVNGNGEGNGEPSEPAPAAQPPEMGLNPNAPAYARAVAAAQKEAIEAIVEANPHLNDGQKAIVRKQPTAALAREMVATYPRAAPAPATMGLPAHPSTVQGGGKPLSPLAREMKAAETDPVFCRALGIGTTENTGVSYETPGCIVYIDGSERLRHQRQIYRERKAAQ